MKGKMNGEGEKWKLVVTVRANCHICSTTYLPLWRIHSSKRNVRGPPLKLFVNPVPTRVRPLSRKLRAVLWNLFWPRSCAYTKKCLSPSSPLVRALMTIVIRKRTESLVWCACTRRKKPAGALRRKGVRRTRQEKRSLSTMTGSGVIVVGKV